METIRKCYGMLLSLGYARRLLPGHSVSTVVLQLMTAWKSRTFWGLDSGSMFSSLFDQERNISHLHAQLQVLDSQSSALAGQ